MDANDYEVISDYVVRCYAAGGRALGIDQVVIDAVMVNNSPGIRFAMPHNGDQIILGWQRINQLRESLRYFGETGRWEKNPPAPLAQLSVIRTGHGLTVRFKRATFFFLEDTDAFVATKTEWRRRGYKLADGDEKYHAYKRLWNGRSYNTFWLYRFDQCKEIGGKKAKWRRGDFKIVIEHLIGLKIEFQNLGIAVPFGFLDKSP